MPYEVLRGEVVELPLDSLQGAEWNPQEMSDPEFNLLCQELGQTGQIDPIQVVPLAALPGQAQTYRIIGGHQRTAAAKVLGWDKIACVVLAGAKFQDEDLQKFLTVRLNILRGKLNPEKFVKLYQEMSAKYGEDSLADLMGFSDQEALKKLVGNVGQALKDTGLDKALADKFNKAAKEVKTVDELSMVLNQLFSEYGSTVDQNFMVFVFGGKKHLYVSASLTLWKLVEQLTDYATLSGTDINAPLFLALSEFAKVARIEDKIAEIRKKALEQQAQSIPDVSADDTPF